MCAGVGVVKFENQGKIMNRKNDTDCYDSKPWLQHYFEGVPAVINYEELTIPDILDRSAEKWPDRDALIFQGYRMTFRELQEAVDSFASCLQSFGVCKGDAVAILLPNMIPCVVAYYAALRIGAIAVMNNPLYSDRELKHQFNDTDAKILVTIDLLANRMVNLRPETKIRQIIYTTLGDYLPVVKKLLFPLAAKKKGLSVSVAEAAELYRWKDCIKNFRSVPSRVQLVFDDVAVYQFSGGTTGVSKAAILTHRNLSCMVQMYREWFHSEGKVHGLMLSAPPIFHVLGMSAAMNLPLFVGWTSLLIPKPQAPELLEAIRKYRPTGSPLVPTMYVGMLQHPDLEKTDLSCFKLMTSGGSSLPVEVLNRFKDLTGVEINEGFGMTETSPQTHLNPFGGKTKPGSIGIPFPDTDVRIVDLETGEKILPQGEEGEMIFRGPQMTGGYLNRPDETEKTIRGGWIYSGDIAYMDEDGYFFVVDRKKDLIISGGFNIYPRDIEEVFYEHPKVDKAAAIGIPDVKRGENVKIFISLKEDETATPEEMMEFCQPKLAKYKWPATIEIRDELPVSTVGKILKKELRAEELGKK